jgi:AcrR family transcriptional regulator
VTPVPRTGADVPVGTRELVLEAASQLFQQRGYGSVSIRDIGAAVGISTSTLYHHFVDKRGILFEITERFMADFNRAMADAAAQTLPSRSWVRW